MRKVLFVIALLTFALALAAGPKEEALESLDNAKQLINQNNLVKAQDEINFALSKLNEIQAEELLKYIPEAPAGFKLENKDSQALGAAGALFGSANSIMATGEYTKNEMSFNLSITVGGIAGQTGGLMNLANMFGGVSTTGNTKTVRVNGYNGNQEYNKEESSGTLTIQVGSKITVIVSGTDIPNADLLKTIAEKVEMAKLEKSF